MIGIEPPDGMNLALVVADIVRIVAMAAGLYFFVGIVLNLLQAQVASTFGDKPGYAHAMEQVLAMTVLIAVAGSTYPLVNSIIPGIDKVAIQSESVDPAAAANGVRIFWEGLARIVISFLIGAGVMTSIVKAVYSGVIGQVGMLFGSPNAVSGAVMQIGAAATGGILTVFGVWLANTLLTQIFSG